MRALRDLQDVKLVLKELIDWKDRLTSKDWNFTGLRITNASPSKDDYDYVVRKELVSAIPSTTNPKYLYSICFQSNGETLAPGTNVSSSYIVGLGREGIIVRTYISLNPDQTATSNIIVRPSFNGADILSSSFLTLPAGSRTAYSSYIVQPNIRLQELDLINLDIVTVAAADENKTLEVQVQVQVF